MRKSLQKKPAIYITTSARWVTFFNKISQIEDDYNTLTAMERVRVGESNGGALGGLRYWKIARIFWSHIFSPVSLSRSPVSSLSFGE